MNKAGKIVLGVIAGVTVFALGVQFHEPVLNMMNGIKDKFTGNKKPTVIGDDLSALKDRIADEIMLKNPIANVYAIGVHEEAGVKFIRITVKDEHTKAHVSKYLKKNSISESNIKIVLGQMAKAL